MLRAKIPTHYELEIVTLEELVPQDHLLGLIDRHIRFDFIREKTAHLYCADNGRPALDPELLFKMLFIGYLFGIRSERQLMREIQVNVAYRWFLRLRLTDKVPDASTLSQNCRRRFAGTDIEQQIFDAIVEQAIEHGLIGRRVLYFDVAAAGLDAGYFTPAICKGLEERGIYGVIGYRRPTHREGYFYKREFVY